MVMCRSPKRRSLKVAGDLVYARGEDYVRYVRGLRTTDFKAYASIQAKNVYQVELTGPVRYPTGPAPVRIMPTATSASIWSRQDSPRSTPDGSRSTTQPAVRPTRRCTQRCRRWRPTSCGNWSWPLPSAMKECADCWRFVPRQRQVTTRTPKPSSRASCARHVGVPRLHRLPAILRGRECGQ